MFPPPIPPHRSSTPGEALTPDPLFMALRSALIRGPLGWLSHWLDIWRDAREARRESAAAVAAANDLIRSATPVTTLVDHAEPPVDLAA